MLRFAVIGAVHSATIAAHPGAELVLVADPVGESAASLARTHGARSTTDVADVHAAADVDAVVVGSPTPYHVDQIVGSVRAGKAVLAEKPIDLDLRRLTSAWRPWARGPRGSWWASTAGSTRGSRRSASGCPRATSGLWSS